MKYIAGLVSWFGIYDRNDENVLELAKVKERAVSHAPSLSNDNWR